MKVLKGSLTETRFATPTESDVEHQRPMTKIHETTFSENDVTYMADTLGVHRISNPHPTEYAVSLHCVSPPLLHQFYLLGHRSTNPCPSVHSTQRGDVRMQRLQRRHFGRRSQHYMSFLLRVRR
jgi:hypothetical protein